MKQDASRMALVAQISLPYSKPTLYEIAHVGSCGLITKSTLREDISMSYLHVVNFLK